MGGALVDLGLAEFDKIFTINTRATWLIGTAAHPHLKASKGAFISTASMSATQPTPALGFYSSRKAALLLMVRQIGRASCRDRVCQYVLLSVVGVSIKKKNQSTC